MPHLATLFFIHRSCFPLSGHARLVFFRDGRFLLPTFIFIYLGRTDEAAHQKQPDSICILPFRIPAAFQFSTFH